jgi:hypothetical protein
LFARIRFSQRSGGNNADKPFGCFQAKRSFVDGIPGGSRRVDHDTRITRVTRAFSAVTSQIFRCHGLEQSSGRTDSLGCHDILYWLLFCSALSAWFLFIFVPQRERVEHLQGRLDSLKTHVQAERKELQRAQRGIKDLERNAPDAWERAARSRLGWMEDGEVLDVVGWRHNHKRNQIRLSSPETSRSSAFDPATLRRPQIPALPVPSSALRSAGLSLPLAPRAPTASVAAAATPPPPSPLIARRAAAGKPAARPSPLALPATSLPRGVR